MHLAQSYIVRIYARPQTAGAVGTVEVVGSGKREGFSSADELLRILMAARACARWSRCRWKR